MYTPQVQRRSALEGVRVLDFSIMMAGPFCGRLLADFGADVIKVEPLDGDDMRLRAPLRDGQSAYFGQLNAGKRSLALDLKREEAVDLLRRLVKQTDIVLENFRPRVMARLGLGYEALSAINPRLIYCSISGYGQTGPAAQRPAYAMIVHAGSGFDRTLMRYAGDRERPASSAVFVADVLGAVYAHSAIQTALFQRSRTGVGQYIDIALMDCMLNLLVYELQEAQFSAAMPRPTYGPVCALDGDILIAPITPRNFSALCEVTQLSALSSDTRFTSLPARNANWSAMMQIVEQWTRTRTVAQCLEAFERAGVPCSEYRDPGDAFADPHLLERGLFSTLKDSAGEFKGINPPWKMSDAATDVRPDVPGIGQHTRAILSDVAGICSEEVQCLIDAGVIGEGRR